MIKRGIRIAGLALLADYDGRIKALLGGVFGPENDFDAALGGVNLAGVAAVENGNVHRMPGDAEAWDSPVPGGILGAVWYFCVLHPEACPEAEGEAAIREFYETFYGFSYGEN